MMNINNLVRQHEAIRENVKTIESLINKNSIENDSFEISKNINLLIGVLKVHLQSEDNFLYPELLNGDDDKLKDMAKHYIDEMGNINAELEKYKAEFNTKTKINNNIESFKNHTAEIIKVLKNRLDKEDKHLYPLIK
ncbi:cation-binding protein [Clostridium carboxidivorans P7]|uniref:Hemerythrin HHE cation binding domain protein n=1 Tax=Clostridium carboxidivorans P7 TaxID=536227 RepID=C6Q1U0_9CLOT|nr:MULTISPECIES: hemerythrin domain-containing protein [Clostridium]AKN29778.1 cation-binding protein [Clostridium carboxidivorans P7]EET84533.1 Hemerythrin HHE cation binding domain protein [Clostridium carboxidivorans P7]EFG89097.1 hemerythrin HHE cation binding domain protein [Clostridium carboxidivorans P7]WPC40334.1 hemerythrin domain-containing protein [Clostridium sp. JS66]